MLREFFLCGPKRRVVFAWSGLVVFVSHALFSAWLKWALNGWYASFYDELQDLGSGFDADDRMHLLEKRRAVSTQLFNFTLIVAPAVVVHPFCKFIASMWRFEWRMALIKSYLAHYDVTTSPLEGTAQRIQEDTMRFETGVYSCGTVVLDSFLTLLIFVPVLLEVGGATQPEGVDWPAWLLSVAIFAAVGGLGISMVVGRKLVWLEVANQRVEAFFRTNLVLLEQSPASVVGAADDDACVAAPAEESTFDETPRRTAPTPRPVAPTLAFAETLNDLWANYKRLFRNFAAFNTWIAFYSQVMVILPFVLIAPLMFAGEPEDRITLGTLMKASNAFDKVFGALAVVTESWADINTFRSTIRRLQEFERALYWNKPFDRALSCGDTPTYSSYTHTTRTNRVSEVVPELVEVRASARVASHRAEQDEFHDL